MVLEKTLQSPLDCKEIKPVNLKGNQSLIFIGRTYAEAEASILWSPNAKNGLNGKDPDAGKDWRQEENAMTEDEMVGWHHWLNGHEFEQVSGAGYGQGSLACCSPSGHRVRHNWVTELNWTETNSTSHPLNWQKANYSTTLNVVFSLYRQLTHTVVGIEHFQRAILYSVQLVQLLSPVQLFATPWTAACQVSLFITNSRSLLKLISIESGMPSNHLILYCLSLLPPSVFPSIRIFSNELVLCIRWPKYWSFSFNISPSKEYSGLISFRID